MRWQFASQRRAPPYGAMADTLRRLLDTIGRLQAALAAQADAAPRAEGEARAKRRRLAAAQAGAQRARARARSALARPSRRRRTSGGAQPRGAQAAR
jgi:hypothetical protein